MSPDQDRITDLLGEIESELLQRFYRYWNEKREGRRAPGRGDLDPAETGELLPNVFLVDVEGVPRRYRYRLVGTAFGRHYGEELTGRYVDDMDLGDFKLEALASLDSVADTWEPSYINGRFAKQDGRRLAFGRLALPLTSDGETIDMICGCTDFTYLNR